MSSHMAGWRNLKELNYWLLSCFCVLVNRKASNCINRLDDATVREFVPRVSPSYLNFTVSDIYLCASFMARVLNSK